MGQWVFQDCMVQVSLKHPVSKVFVSLGCFRFLDCDFRQRPRRINGLTWPWSHGSSDAWPSKAMSATQHNMIPFSSGWEEQNCWKMHQFSISLNPPKKTWTPKTAMTNAEPCACQHAASDIYIYISIALICFVDATNIAPLLVNGCKICCSYQSAAKTPTADVSLQIICHWRNGLSQWNSTMTDSEMLESQRFPAYPPGD